MIYHCIVTFSDLPFHNYSYCLLILLAIAAIGEGARKVCNSFIVLSPRGGRTSYPNPKVMVGIQTGLRQCDPAAPFFVLPTGCGRTALHIPNVAFSRIVLRFPTVEGYTRDPVVFYSLCKLFLHIASKGTFHYLVRCWFLFFTDLNLLMMAPGFGDAARSVSQSLLNSLIMISRSISLPQDRQGVSYRLEWRTTQSFIIRSQVRHLTPAHSVLSSSFYPQEPIFTPLIIAQHESCLARPIAKGGLFQVRGQCLCLSGRLVHNSTPDLFRTKSAWCGVDNIHIAYWIYEFALTGLGKEDPAAEI